MQTSLRQDADLQSTLDDVIDEVIERSIAKSGEGGLVGQATSALENELRLAANQRLSGFGVLQQFLDDPAIEEIWVNQPNEVFIATGQGHQRLEVDLDAASLSTLVEKMLQSSGRRIDRTTPFVDASLPDGSRLHVIIPSLTRRHWAVNIRKFGGRVFTLSQLYELGTLSQTQLEILREAMFSGKNILVSGATQAGKTTLLCALVAELNSDEQAQNERLVSVEETFEIRCDLPDWVALQARQPNLEQQGEVNLRRLIVEALRMRPTRLVVGEVRQAEALDLLIALNSGLPGLCTIHANSAQDAVRKIATLPLLAGANITSEFVQPTIGACIDLVVHCALLPTGQRKVVEICSVDFDAERSELVIHRVD